MRREEGQPWRRLLLVVLLAALVSAGGAMVYATRVAEQSQRQLCGLIAAQADAYREAPPTTAAGRRVAEAVAQLRADFHCPAP